MIDSTVTLAIIVSLCALISAPITAIINNRYQLKLRELELKNQEKLHRFDVVYQKKLAAYETMIDSVSKAGSVSFQDQSAALAAAHNALLLCDEMTYSKLEDLVFGIPQDHREYPEWMSLVIKDLNQELRELSATK